MTTTESEDHRRFYYQRDEPLIPGAQRIADKITDVLTEFGPKLDDETRAAIVKLAARAAYSHQEGAVMRVHDEYAQKWLAARGKVRCLAKMLRYAAASTLDELWADPNIGRWMRALYDAALSAEDGDDLDRPSLPTWT